MIPDPDPTTLKFLFIPFIVITVFVTFIIISKDNENSRKKITDSLKRKKLDTQSEELSYSEILAKKNYSDELTLANHDKQSKNKSGTNVNYKLTKNIYIKYISILCFICWLVIMWNQNNIIREMENYPKDIINFAFFVAGFVFVILGLVFMNRCPECKKKHALKKTGATEKSGYFKPIRREYKCKYCGYRQWKDDANF